MKAGLQRRTTRRAKTPGKPVSRGHKSRAARGHRKLDAGGEELPVGRGKEGSPDFRLPAPEL